MNLLYKLKSFGARSSLLEAMRMEAKSDEVALDRVFVSAMPQQKRLELLFQCRAVREHRSGIGTDLAPIFRQGLYSTTDGALGAAAESVSRCTSSFPATQFFFQLWGPYRIKSFDKAKQQWTDVAPVRMRCTYCGKTVERTGTDALDADELTWLCSSECNGRLARI
jgi:hypothetical protein